MICRVFFGRWRVLSGVSLAILIVGMVAAPWPSSSPAVAIREFDPDLITVDPRGFLSRAGRVDLSPRELVVETTPYSQPTVHLLTARVPFTVSFSVALLSRDSEVFPFQVKIWNPRAEVAAEVWYAPDGRVMAAVRAHDVWQEAQSIGRYTVGGVQRWRIIRDETRVVFEVGGGRWDVNQDRFPVLFKQDTLSLTLYASAPREGTSTVIVQNPVIEVPYQERYGSTVDSLVFRLAIIIVAVLSFLWMSTRIGLLLRPLSPRSVDLLVALLLLAASFAIGARLSTTPGHPYDMRTMVLWTRIAAEHGPKGIIQRSLVATEGEAHGGQPYETMGYLYSPLLLYPLWLIGRIAPSIHAEQILKIAATLGVGISGMLLFFVSRRLGLSLRVAVPAAVAYVLNPAVLFDAAVWGQTEAFVAIFLMIGTGGVVLNSAPLVWAGVLLAVLTKQTGALFGLGVILFGFARLGVRRMAHGLPPALAVVFLLLTPILLTGIHPSVVYRSLVAAFDSFGREASGDMVNAVVSQGAFTLWSTLTALEGGQGLARQAFPDFTASLLGPSYFTLSRFAFAMFTFLLVLLIVRRPRPISPGFALVGIAVYQVAAVVLLTRMHARYFYFGIMSVAVSLPWMSRWLGATAMTVLSGAMLIGMWGTLVLTSILYPGQVPEFAPERSWINGTMAAVLQNDIGTTVGGILTVGALLILLVGLWKGGRPGPTDASPTGTRGGS